MTRRGIRPGFPASLAVLVFAGATALGCPDPDGTSSLPATRVQAGETQDPTAVIPPSAPPRIVSLSPLATRFLTELGVGAQIVSLDGVLDPAAAGMSGLSDGRIPDLDDLVRLEPDYVFLPALPDDQADLEALEAAGARVVEFAPHDLEDVFAYCRGVGRDLVGEEAATLFERRVARPLSLIAGQSSPTDRLRVIALVGVDPPEIAGGHSFETDLIEIAGASSLTHGGDDNRQPIDPAGLAKLIPDLVVVMTEVELGPADQDRALAFTGALAPVVFFPFARETFWLEEPARDAARLREAIVALEQARATAERR